MDSSGLTPLDSWHLGHSIQSMASGADRVQSHPFSATGGRVIHPDFESEQAYIELAHAILFDSRNRAKRMHAIVESGEGGTHQARFERDVIHETVANRVSQLDIGDASLVFGRLDLAEDAGGDTFYVGRVAVWDDRQDPITVDWRAPIAEPFYRATGRQPMGLVRRRHFATRGRTLLGLEDEYFGESAVLALEDGPQLRGRETLVTMLEQSRTGRLGDIVATIQAEQDEIIRSPLPGALVVQGGPGTGKTVVALHRAAYLLYTHRFPLEGQGVLVVGPNRVFLTYIEQVLPSLGEAGVQLAVLADLVPRVRVRGVDREHIARVKGDGVMAQVIRNAVRDRERALREDLVIGFGIQRLRVTKAASASIIAEARRRYRKHNQARSFVENELYAELTESSRDDLEIDLVKERLAGNMAIREALEWMWPVLTPEHLLHDLFGSPALLRSAGKGSLRRDESELLHRPRSPHADHVVWTAHDVPLLDEARAVLGPRPGFKAEDEIRTYGHIVVDEAQDLSPMQLRMLHRRSLNGSFTIVGDIAQATGAWAHDDWSSVLEHLPQKRPPRRAELTVGYRLPEPTMRVAAKVLAVAAPSVTPPVAVRRSGDEPRFVRAPAGRTVAELLPGVVAEELAAIDSGNLAVIAPDEMVDQLSAALSAAGVEHGRVYEGALEQQVTIVPVRLIKGLELDAAVVVEPVAILGSEAQGMRALYVALTRATRRLVVLHGEDLPPALAASEPIDPTLSGTA
jgi:DNA helicase IV